LVVVLLSVLSVVSLVGAHTHVNDGGAASPRAPLPPSAKGAASVVFFQCDEMDGREVDPGHQVRAQPWHT
jgi:hypothetical protein